MKILQFVTRLDLGGAQQMCLAQCRHLLARGHEVHLLTGPGGELLDEAKGIRGLRLHIWEDWRHEIRPPADLRALSRLTTWLREEGFDVLHTHSSKAGFVGRLAAWRAGSPRAVVHQVHGWSFNRSQPPWTRKLFVMLERFAARPGGVLLPCSTATAREGRRRGIGRGCEMQVLYCGIERPRPVTAARRAWARRSLGVGRRDVLFLLLGNLKPQKDPCTFARAAARASRVMRRARFWIVGDGPLRKEVETIARRHGLGERFRVLGWRRDVERLLWAADVLVLTSAFEGLPIALMRALARGLPTVATAVDGNVEALEHGRLGILVPPGDAGAAAEAMAALGRDPGRRRRLGRRGRRSWPRFRLEDSLQALERVYRRALDSGAGDEGLRPQPVFSRPAETRGGGRVAAL